MRPTIALVVFILSALPPCTAAAYDCLHGEYEFGSPDGWVNGFLVGDDQYAFLMDPQTHTCCEDGTLPSQAFMDLRAGQGEYGFPSIGFSIREAVWDQAEQAYRPGVEVCRTLDAWFLNIDIAGEYPIVLPPAEGGAGGFVDCPCLDAGQPWFLVFHIGALDEGVELDVAVEGPATPDIFYVKRSAGDWEDLVDVHGWTGGLPLALGVNCCSGAVSTETRSWSDVKGLYR